MASVLALVHLWLGFGVHLWLGLGTIWGSGFWYPFDDIWMVGWLAGWLVGRLVSRSVGLLVCWSNGWAAWFASVL